MKIEVNDKNQMELTKIYNPIKLKADNTEITVQERDGGFEIFINGSMYFANDKKIIKSVDKKENQLIRTLAKKGFKVDKKEKIVSIPLESDILSPYFNMIIELRERFGYIVQHSLWR